MLFQAVPHGAGAGRLEQVIAAHRLRARRRWIFRATASLAISATLLVLVVVVRRDRMNVSDCLSSMEKPVAALQAEVTALGQLPAALPDIPARTNLAYASDLIREYAREATGPVVVATSETRQLILRPDGNGVIIYENGELRREWWSRVELVTRLTAQNAAIRAWDSERRSRPPQLP